MYMYTLSSKQGKSIFSYTSTDYITWASVVREGSCYPLSKFQFTASSESIYTFISERPFLLHVSQNTIEDSLK